MENNKIIEQVVQGIPFKEMRCPKCGYLASSLQIQMASHDYLCIGCLKVRLSEYIEVVKEVKTNAS